LLFNKFSECILGLWRVVGTGDQGFVKSGNELSSLDLLTLAFIVVDKSLDYLLFLLALVRIGGGVADGCTALLELLDSLAIGLVRREEDLRLGLSLGWLAKFELANYRSLELGNQLSLILLLTLPVSDHLPVQVFLLLDFFFVLHLVFRELGASKLTILFFVLVISKLCSFDRSLNSCRRLSESRIAVKDGLDSEEVAFNFVQLFADVPDGFSCVSLRRQSPLFSLWLPDSRVQL